MAFRPNWYDDERSRSWSRSPASWSGVRWVITLTLGVFVLQLVESGLLGTQNLTALGALRAWQRPSDAELLTGSVEHGAFNVWFVPQLVSYALLHAGLGHIFWNLLFLFFFGPELEAKLGRRGFLRLYIGGAAAGGLLQWIWYLVKGDSGMVIGASGAVFAVSVVYALNWPHRTLLIWGLLPVPVWLFVSLEVLLNVIGFLGPSRGVVSVLAHIGGAAYGLLSHRAGSVLERVALRWRQEKAGREMAATQAERREMDRILGKIQATGLSSLDRSEREFLDRRSRELREQQR